MASKHQTTKWKYTKAALEIGQEHPDIYGSVEDWVQLQTDFLMLMRVCSHERLHGGAVVVSIALSSTSASL